MSALVFLEWRRTLTWELPSIPSDSGAAVAVWPVEGRPGEVPSSAGSRPLAPLDGPPAWATGDLREAAWSPELATPHEATAVLARLLAAEAPVPGARAVVWWRPEERRAFGRPYARGEPTDVRLAVALFPCPASPRAGDGGTVAAPGWVDGRAMPLAVVLEVMGS